MTPTLNITYFCSLSHGITIRKVADKFQIREGADLPEGITQAEANAIALAVLNGEGVMV